MVSFASVEFLWETSWKKFPTPFKNFPKKFLKDIVPLSEQTALKLCALTEQ